MKARELPGRLMVLLSMTRRVVPLDSVVLVSGNVTFVAFAE